MAGVWRDDPAPIVLVKGDQQRELAERDCLSAVAFALDGDPEHHDPSAEAVTLKITITSAA
ncbi:MAG: hypothetical protein ACR2FU_15715 [Streptosporangiaceae bacterium]